MSRFWVISGRSRRQVTSFVRRAGRGPVSPDQPSSPPLARPPSRLELMSYCTSFPDERVDVCAPSTVPHRAGCSSHERPAPAPRLMSSSTALSTSASDRSSSTADDSTPRSVELSHRQRESAVADLGRRYMEARRGRTEPGVHLRLDLAGLADEHLEVRVRLLELRVRVLDESPVNG